MNKNIIKKSFIILVFLLFFIPSFSVTTLGSTDFHAIKGKLYINYELAGAGIEIQLDVPDKSFTTTVETAEPDINGYNFYAGFDYSFYESTVYFTVIYNQQELIPIDNQSVVLDKNIELIEQYILDLNVLAGVNSPPNKPTNPNPANNSENIVTNPALSVVVTDLNDDLMNVTFYNASNNQIIDTANNVASGSTASITWTGLSYNKTYSWYAVANDSKSETQSDTWTFTTKEQGNEKPSVKITKPEEKTLYIFNTKIFSNLPFMPIIIGDFTIEANATDDNGIEKVEFYIYDIRTIGGKLVGNDTTEPYTFDWTKDKTRLIHVYKIKVIAYDFDGLTDEDQMFVRKFL